MRPLRLSMTAFGPYAGTEVVDFDALTDLGLFVVAGNNGSGKTTIFDALHYSLFGTLPGRRASYIRLKSDHADESAECSVTLDFVAHGAYWRVERSPKQKRPKRRGNGSTQVDRRATLYRLDDGPAGTATAVANKIGEVDTQCRELVGLSGKQFERVALLPQGEFSRVLRESSTERRELLRTLFSSELFDDATSDLTTKAAEAAAQDRSVLDRLDHQQASLAEEVARLVSAPVANSVNELERALSDYRQTYIATCKTRVAALESQATETNQAHRSGVELSRRIERRQAIVSEQANHLASLDHHHQDVSRLDQARAAVPVVSHARTVTQQRGRVATTRTKVDKLQHQLNDAIKVSGLPAIAGLDAASMTSVQAQLEQLADKLAKRHDIAVRTSDLQAQVNQSHAEWRRTRNEISVLDEQRQVALTQQRQATRELARLDTAPDIDACEQELRVAMAQLDQRIELYESEVEHQKLIRRANDLDATLSQTQVEFEKARQAQTSHVSLQHKAAAALKVLHECTQRHAAAQTYAAAHAQLFQARATFDHAVAFADQQWDSFIAGTAARVASTLIDEEPCPVCGSADHPSPATAPTGDTVANQEDVAAARTSADDAQSTLRRIEAQIEALRQTFTDIASLVVPELEADISTAKAMALGAQTVADEAHQAAKQADQLSVQLDQARATRADLDDDLRALDERRNRLHGALGPIATQLVAELQVTVDTATQARAAADQNAHQRAEATAALQELDREIETIGLGQIAAQSRRDSAADLMADRQSAFETMASALQDLESDLDHREPGIANANFEQRTRACRAALEFVNEMGTETALHREALDGVRRAESLLGERLDQSPFSTIDQALAAFLEPHLIEQLEAQTSTYRASAERLAGQLQALADLPDHAPDIQALEHAANQAAESFRQENHRLITTSSDCDRIESDLASLIAERRARQTIDSETSRLERVAALVKGDNDRNTSLENWVLGAHLRDVVELANIRLARSTHQRFQLCVLDDGENKRGRWGLDLGVEDTVTGTRRPTAGLSGGELFQASLALALGLADAVMSQSAGVRIDALFIDEGFGSLDEQSVERAIDLLDELRDRGAMVGVITHVPALLEALPIGVSVVDAANGAGSTINQHRLAA